MPAEGVQKSPYVCLHVALLSDAVQGNERGNVVAADPQSRLQVHLQVVGVQVDTLVGRRHGNAHSFTVASLDDVVAA